MFAEVAAAVSIQTDPSSTLNLNEYSLSVGSLGTDDILTGKLIGSAKSQLFKVGSGTMTLNGDHHSFKGKTVVNGGTVVLKQDLVGDAYVVSTGSSLEICDHARAGSNQINIRHGKAIFKGESSADDALIKITDGGELAFLDTSSGGSCECPLVRTVLYRLLKTILLGLFLAIPAQAFF